jgi:carbon monoxide dehydrogenase subunit G
LPRICRGFPDLYDAGAAAGYFEVMRFVITQTLDAPLDAVFDVICDPRRRLEWQSSLHHVQVSSDGEPEAGTRWREITRGGIQFEMEITELERPSRWAEQARGRLADARISVDLEAASPGSTRLAVSVEIDFKGLARLGAPLVKATMPRALRADLRRVEVLARRAARIN